MSALSFAIVLALAADVPPAPTTPTTAPSSSTSSTSSTSSMSIAVVSLRADESLAGPAKALTTIVATEIGSMRGYRAIAPNELRSMLDNAAMQQLLGCEDAACVANFSSVLATDRIVIGSLERAAGESDGAVVVSISLVDPAAAAVLARRTETWRGPLDDIVSLPRPMLQQLLLGSSVVDNRGHLDVLVGDGVSVTIDGDVVGTSPLDRRLPLAVGAHDVVLQKPGFVTQRRTVAVAADETNVLQAELVDEQSLLPWYARWYVWGPVAGGVVLVGAATAGFVAYNVLADQPTTIGFK
ncbi:MAG TPA: PEGA domain-containing protein [Myxococcota bacterium]